MTDQAIQTGVMLALFLPDEAAKELSRQVAPVLLAAGIEAEAPEDYHITLVYAGDSAAIADRRADIGLAISSLGDEDVARNSLSGQINGIGRFMTAEDNDTNALYATFDAVDLPSFRNQLMTLMNGIGIGTQQNHGFIPHITLAYLPAEMATPDVRITPIDVTFQDLVLAWGDERDTFDLDGDAYEESKKMNFTVVKTGDADFAVHRQSANGRPTGQPLSKHKTKQQADDQMSTLLKANSTVTDGSDKAGAKYWDDPVSAYEASDYVPQIKLYQDDPRVKYDPIGGLSGGKACANCLFFNAQNSTCQVIWGTIVPTGNSAFWTAATMPTEEAKPVPVVIVESGAAEASVEAISKGWLTRIKELIGGKKEDIVSGFKVLPDGHWIAYYTNSFEDKEEEIFTEKAHDGFIARVDAKEVPAPELWWWHLPVRSGAAEWVGRVGHIMVAVGTFDETPTGQHFKDYYRRNNKDHGVSHGYLYPRNAKVGGLYHAYNTFEISPMPKGREANAYTSFSEVKEMPITDEKRKSLEAILGADLAAQYLNNAETSSKAIEDLGVKFKEVPGVLVDSEAREAIKEIAGAVSADSAGLKELTGKLDQILTAVKAVQDGEVARNTRVEQIEQAVKAAFELQPSPRMAQQTVIPANNPLLVALQEKQLQGEQSGLGIFDMFGLSELGKKE